MAANGKQKAASGKQKAVVKKATKKVAVSTKKAVSSPAGSEYPLRSKRRLETRAALIRSAIELMQKHGFDAVTMQQVADNAGTHAQTLYSHFPNKYSLSAAASVESLRAALDKRKTDTLTFWREWVRKRTQEVASGEGATALFGLLEDTLDKPRFALVQLAISQEYVDVLTTSLAADFGLDRNIDLFPKLVAQMLMAASEHSIINWHNSKGEFDLLAGELSGIEEVAQIVELACAAKGISIKKKI